MIFDNFGNMVNNDGTAINSPLDGTFSSVDSTNGFTSGGAIKKDTYIQGRLIMLDDSGNAVIIFDPNG